MDILYILTSSDVVAETAAALAAGSIAIKHVDPTRSKLYLKHAIELFHFANKHRGKYSDCKFFVENKTEIIVEIQHSRLR